MIEETAIEVAVSCPAWRETLPEAEDLCRRAARAACAAGRRGPLRRGPVEASLVLADDDALRTLNRDYRGRDKATNVLSFPASETDSERAPGAPRMLGDVIVAFGTAAAEAAAQGKSLADHLSHLVVHGMLHLLGHGHQTEADAERMERLETRVLAGLGVADPYSA